MSARSRLHTVRPLDSLRSIKVKLGALVVASCAVTGAVTWAGLAHGVPAPVSVLLAVAVALLVTQVLAHGMVAPLREMTAAAQLMASGDYSRRVPATGGDEVGRAAAAFNTMAADLEAVDRQRRELVANVAHELRTPVAGLQALLENLADGVTAPGPATLGTALAQTQRLGRLVDELLDLSRVDGGAALLERQDLAVRPLLEAAAEQAGLSAQARESGVSYAVAVAPPGLRAWADPNRLHQLVANLLDNAARHSPPHGEVRITAAPWGDGVVLTVADAGPGIAPAERDRVFERFIRGGPAGSPAAGGTGLGLAICRWVAHLHDGDIRVAEPVNGTGCTIRVELPGRTS